MVKHASSSSSSPSSPSSIFLLSPSEGKLADLFEDNAVTSALPEQKGADILLYTKCGLLGWQRKSVPNDFIDSVQDGRFARLLPLLSKSCAFPRLIVEGDFEFWPDGTVFLGMCKDKTGIPKRIMCRFTRSQIHGILNDIEIVWNVPMRHTEDVGDTVRYLKSVQKFVEAKSHIGLHTRPKLKGTWYVPSTNELHLWILQGFPGVGAKTADKIINRFGGVPIRWTCSPEQLASIGGITLKKAVEWVSILNGTTNTSHTSHTAAQTPTDDFNVSVSSVFNALREKLKG